MYCKRATATRHSAVCCAKAPTRVIGAIAPDRVKGVTITSWLRRAIRIAPSSIGQSCFSGDDEFMLVAILVCRSKSSSLTPAAIWNIVIASSILSVPSENTDITLSVSTRASNSASRWRIDGCMSTGSTGYPLLKWIQLKTWLSFKKFW